MTAIASNSDYAIQIQQAKAAGLLPKNMPVNRKGWETAQALEANFFQTMLGSMFEGVDGEGPMGNGPGQDAWRGMLIENYGQTIAAKGGVGLAPQIYREMLRHQELSAHASQRSGL
ncbi:MAG: rod-binding protein [Methylobacterium sp.]|nr:MAG: rod-binding protein [Methylobacterium sp.]